MNDIIGKLSLSGNTPYKIFLLVINIIVALCIVALFTAILINFVEARARSHVKNEKRSVVETGTMTLFFLLFYFLLCLRIGVISIMSMKVKCILTVFGLLLVVFGCCFNIIGRFNLGANWANQVLIYDDHKLIDKGVYRIVRHPLYASLIMMFFGASLIYRNSAAFLANLFIFIPFMTYRAKQEEEALRKEFPEYQDYQKKTGMFWPKMIRKG
ncbi:MAG TPA: isoprenylcysteine carboxylmethyltransferase family protein [Bacillota bacterium]|jgi:protein-S-isoprenylcysteine O-methyltransferase Ste14|nr:isoprenylcysteine carboxylmethyltransferase family protein [Bacillota bacterium]